MVIRKRYHIWLIKAYFKKWSRTILTSLIIGFILFFLLVGLINFYVRPLIEKKVQKIGYWGVYTSDSLPENILKDLSYGLTVVGSDGSIKPGIAQSWEIQESGRVYVFHLKKNLKYNNGEEVTANNINLEFKDTFKRAFDKYTLGYKLKNPYSPFLVSASKPIFIKDFIGIGSYEMKKIDLNAGFVKSIVLEDKNNSANRKTIFFYPTQDSLKTAFLLGEIDKADGMDDLAIKNGSFKDWKNIEISKSTDYSNLVTVFYNNSDSILSDKKVRQALNYAIPPQFAYGERAYSPISPGSFYFSKPTNYGISDMQIAKTLLSTSKAPLDKELEISTTEEYRQVAEIIKQEWLKIGVKSKIKIVSGIQGNFQILIYPFKLPKDPDQYTIWHSEQINNITHYKNLRIDKFLEDGRSTAEAQKRKDIYADFQKYLTDDVPASFLYFPYKYNIIRR